MTEQELAFYLRIARLIAHCAICRFTRMGVRDVQFDPARQVFRLSFGYRSVELIEVGLPLQNLLEKADDPLQAYWVANQIDDILEKRGGASR